MVCKTANPDHPAAERALGLALLADGQPAEALKSFRKPGARSLARVELQAQLQKFAEALAGAKALQEQFPDQNIGQRLEGNLYLRQQDFAKALAAAWDLTETAGRAGAFNLLGAVHLAQGDHPAARAVFEKALALKPDHTTAQMNLATLEVRAGETAAAQSRYRRVLEREPDNLAAAMADQRTER